MTLPSSPSPLSVVLHQLVAERWAKLPTGPDDEFSWAAPIYYVSTLGRVMSVAPGAPPGKRCVLKALRKHSSARRGSVGNKRPHLRCNLHVRKENRGTGAADRGAYVHRLVAATWAPKLGGYLVRHLNGNGLDNRAENLLYGTHSENLHDQYDLGERGAADYDDESRAYHPDLFLGF